MKWVKSRQEYVKRQRIYSMPRLETKKQQLKDLRIKTRPWPPNSKKERFKKSTR